MRLMGWIFVWLGVFLIVTGVVYGLHSGEYEGLTLLLTTAGGALLIGGYLVQGVQRASAAAADQRSWPAGEEPHVGPTIWPLVFALSMIGLVVGAVGSRWALVAGAVLCVVAAAGWALDVHRQWQHHYHSPASESGQSANQVGSG
jgi:hypothetical protein